MDLAQLSPQYLANLRERMDKHTGLPTEPKGCREWRAGSGGDGYGSIGVSGKVMRAHRVAWALHHNTPIPQGLQIIHICNNPRCVNPEHLGLGTPSENMQHRSLSGRHGRAKLTYDDVVLARKLAAKGISVRELAERYKVTHMTMYRVVTGRSWKCVDTVAPPIVLARGKA